MRVFRQAAERIKNSPFIIPFSLVFIAMLVISLGLSWEDYWTSYYGYVLLPTAKANAWIPYLVAIMPQLFQIGFSYVFMEDTNKRWALWIVLISHLADIVTDIWFKINVGHSVHWELVPLAFAESEIIFTLGSELMLTVAFGMVVKIFPDFWREMGFIINPIKELFVKLFHFTFPNFREEIERKPKYNPVQENYRQVNIRRNERPQHRPAYNEFRSEEPKTEEIEDEDLNEVIENTRPEKRGRGRPRKNEFVREDV